MMNRIFKKLSNGEVINILSYIKEYQKSNSELEILIGCDSQNRKQETIYAIVIGLYTPGKGAHVLYSRFSEPRYYFNDKEIDKTRLLNEVWFSVEVAEEIKNKLNIVAKYIDIDLNPDPKFNSNKALSEAVGLVKGMGYNVRHKRQSPMMTYAADHLVK